MTANSAPVKPGTAFRHPENVSHCGCYRCILTGWEEAFAVSVNSKQNVYVAGVSDGYDTGYDYVVLKYRQNPLIYREPVPLE